MMARAQRNYEEEQYDKDVTRHDQQTEVSLGQHETKLPSASIAFILLHSKFINGTLIHAFIHSLIHSCTHVFACSFVCLFMQYASLP